MVNWSEPARSLWQAAFQLNPSIESQVFGAGVKSLNYCDAGEKQHGIGNTETLLSFLSPYLLDTQVWQDRMTEWLGLASNTLALRTP